ncbi:rod shape-determining protein MreC [Clostridium sediminicola]|uniref:rod shape-determining protein MreC n=1 Tax=Clostridium sediminicola TaxID=3114879 RepID=UPI0031F1CC8A
MIKTLLKHKLTVTVLVLSVTFFGIIINTKDNDKKNFIENGIGAVINPIQKVFYKANNIVVSNFKFIVNLKEIKEENKALKAEINELKNKSMNYDALVLENERFRKMTQFMNQRNEYEYIGCDIIGKSGNDWLDGFIINKGSNNDLEKGMVVITGEGLVGQINTVGSNWAMVQTLINENIAVAAIVNSTRDSDCIVKGYRDNGDELLAKLYYLSIDSDIKIGDVVTTSGLGGVYPKEIVLGTVMSIEEDKSKLLKSALIEPAVDFKKLEEIFVVIPKEKRNIKY